MHLHLQPRWPDLLPDLLRDISGRLHHAIDFVRFHAVCRPWHNSHDATATTQPFLPWLLSTKTTKPFDFELWPLHDKLSNMKKYDAHRLTCVFSKTSYPMPAFPGSPSWVTGADGTSLWYSAHHPCSSLHNLLTGATTHVPIIPDKKDVFRHPCGVVYRDGTILMYDKLDMCNDDGDKATEFWAALLRPGEEAAWTVVERTLEAPQFGKFCVTYRGGETLLVSVGPRSWHVVALDNDVSSDILIPNPLWTPPQRKEYFYVSGHILDLHGELLWASVHIQKKFGNCGRDNICNHAQALSLSVYTLQEEMSTAKKMRWVKKESKSLSDHVMFLGWLNSFALDASPLGCDGGCAYFIYSGGEGYMYDWCAVFRYSLIDNKAEFVEWLPQGWHDDECVWLIPQPTMAPVHTCTMQL